MGGILLSLSDKNLPLFDDQSGGNDHSLHLNPVVALNGSLGINTLLPLRDAP